MNRADVAGWVRRAAHVIFLGVICGLANPSRLEATNVSLAWDASTDPAVAGYKVYYGCASRNYTNVIDVGATTLVTVSNLAPGATYWFAATTFSIAGLESDYSTEASYEVPSVPQPQNQAPTVDQPADLTIEQDAGVQTVSLSGISSGSPTENQTLSVSAFSGNTALIPNPTVSYTSPQSSGSLSFAPVPGASRASTVITVMVDDGGSVSNTVIRSFTVTVTATNSAPTLDPIGDVVFDQNSGAHQISLTGITSGDPSENQDLLVSATSDNRNLIPDPVVSYITPNSAATLTLNPVTNAYGSAVITTVVSDGQTLNSTVSRTFKVTVNQVVNPANVLTNATISPGQILKFVLNAPITNGHRFNFTLDSSAPDGAKISTRKGIQSFVWAPSSAQASTTNLINIVATDTTTPTITTNLYAQVIVLDYMAIIAGRTALQAGATGVLPLSVTSSEGITNVTFLLNWPGDRFSNPSLTVISTNATGSVQVQGTNLLINLQTTRRQVLDGSNLVAMLNFKTSPTQSSAFVSMPVTSVTALKPAGSSYVNQAGQLGEVVMVADVPLVRSTLTSTAARELVLYGRVGVAYQVQFSTNLPGGDASWSPLLSYSQTNVSQSLQLKSTAPVIFYRLQQQ